ncbi:MAG TPA: pirin family protein [Candidatus Acidoferrales bacterium]|nr:pirin family protein [Candidatus Acidoferrales bacterium]
MITRRRAEERGATQLSWLDSRHSFSFAEYYDPQHMGFRKLRVINDDRVAPGGGFATHGHRDMEIVTYVLAGALEHKDSLGNGSIIRPGDAQRMSAGTGIQHSEFNHSKSEPVHLLQIWILPSAAGIRPGYEQKTIPAAELNGRLRCIASPDGNDGSVTIHQDCRIYAARLAAGERVTHALSAGRYAWVQLARGGAKLNGEAFAEGDGAAVSNETVVEIASDAGNEILLFDLG